MEPPTPPARFIVDQDPDADVKVLGMKLPDGSYALAVHPDVLSGDTEVRNSAHDAFVRQFRESQAA